METDPLGLKSAPLSSPSQKKLSVELSSPASIVAESPAGADGKPEAEAGGGTTAADAATGGVAVVTIVMAVLVALSPTLSVTRTVTLKLPAVLNT